MLTFYALFICSAITAGNPLRVSFGEDNYRTGDAISNLQLLIPTKDNQHQKKLKPYRAPQGDAPGHLGAVSDGRYSDIPDSEFVLDDANIYFNKPKKSSNKDLSQAHAQSLEENYLKLSTAVETTIKNDQSSETLLQKCRLKLQIEHLRSQFETVLKKNLVDKDLHNENHELLLNLCRIHLALVDKRSEERTSGQVQSVTKSVGYLGVGGSSGISGNIGQGSNNKAVNDRESVAENIEISGIDKFVNKVGKSYKGNSATAKAWGDKVAFKIMNKMGFNSGNHGFDGQGEVGLSGQKGSTGNSKSDAENFDDNGGIPSKHLIIDIIGSGEISKAVLEGHLGNTVAKSHENGHLAAGVMDIVSNIFGVNQDKDEVEHHGLKQMTNDKIREQNRVQCHEETAGQTNGEASGNSKHHSCGHSHCVVVYYFLNPKVKRSGEENLSAPNPLSSESAEDSSADPLKKKVLDVSKFRPLGGRREWMVLSNKYDER